MTHDSSDEHDSRLKDGIETARVKAADAYEAAKEKASKAVDQSRSLAHDATRQTAATIEGNPLGVLVGGLAVGAVIAALIPRSEREKTALASIGKRIGATALAATAAAKTAGRNELEELGLTRGAAKDQAKSLIENLVKAASTAGSAAAKAGTEKAEESKN